MPPFAEIDVCVASHLTTAPPGYCRGCTVKRGSRGITYSCAYTTNPKGSPLASPSHHIPADRGYGQKKKGSGEKEAAFHGNAIYDIDDDYFLGHYPGIYSTVGDVDYKNVRERNWRDGECFVTDVDRDGFIAEYDYTCYY